MVADRHSARIMGQKCLKSRARIGLRYFSIFLFSAYSRRNAMRLRHFRIFSMQHSYF